MRHARTPGLRWAGRAVLLWALLTGMFFMHGAAPPAAGCQGGTPVTPMAAAVMAGTVPDTGHPAAAHTPTGAAAVPAAAASLGRGACGGGMACSSRQPRSTLAAACAAVFFPAGAAIITALPSMVPAAPRGRARPPGRPGLPLPLFLGVSRT